MRLTWIGHATTVLDIGGVRLLTDPLLRPRAGPLRRRGKVPPADLWADTDAILISHLHHDHAELTSLKLLPRLPLITGTTNAAFLTRRKFPGVGLADDEWYDLGSDVQVRLVRADHHSRPMPHRPNDAHGHLIRTPTARVWIAGDTSLYPEMSGLPDLAGGPIDLAVIPVGGWGPRLSGGHLNSETAAQAAAAVGAAVAVPYHWGTFAVPGTFNSPRGWMDLPGALFPRAIEREAPGCRAVVLRPGESLDLEG
jgi:L-ascorbate metabolism protein UlaG (beta-lactamase superfamily)